MINNYKLMFNSFDESSVVSSYSFYEKGKFNFYSRIWSNDVDLCDSLDLLFPFSIWQSQINDEEKDEETISKNKNILSIINTSNNIEKGDSSKNTKNTSDECKKNPKPIKFLVSNLKERIDYTINHFKKHLSQYLTNEANKLIKKSSLPEEYKAKISLPNYKSFTGNPTKDDNKNFLGFKIQEIFGYYKYKEGDKKFRLQEKNKKAIYDIINFIERGNSTKYEEISSFFNMNLEKGIELFYGSKAFKKYAEDPKTKCLDKIFKNQKGFGLSDKNGFIKMVNQFKKNN